MKRIIAPRALFILLLAAVLTPTAFAQSATAVSHANGASGLASAPTEGIVHDDTSGSTEGCGDIDPSEPCYASGGGGESTCTKPYSYDSCVANCDCVYKENFDKCEGKLYCIRTAQSEQRACKSNCIADWNY